jgi:hypothetical protein
MVVNIMLLIMNPGQFLNENVVLNEPVKNQIFNDSTFTRIVYSNSLITTSGIYLKLDIKGASVDKKFNKSSVHFNIYNNRELIELIQGVEMKLLSDIVNKQRVYNLHNEFASGRIIVHDFANVIVLKISGIWETDHSCGITYKLISL